MVKLVKIARIAALAGGMTCAGLLAACGGGVHLEGPGFEQLGLTSNKNKGDTKVPDRAPLLLPPDRAALPEPVTNQQAAANPQANWPNDPDLILKSDAVEADKKQREYEDNGDWSKNAGIDEFEKLLDPALRRKGALSKGKTVDRQYRDDKNYR